MPARAAPSDPVARVRDMMPHLWPAIVYWPIVCALTLAAIAALTTEGTPND